MKSNGYQKLRTVFHAACDLSEPERTKYLDEVCADDVQLRQEVEGLLANDAEWADAFAEANLGIARHLAAQLLDSQSSDSDSSGHGRFLPGTKITGRYRIVSLLGRGGMGEVYRADDLKLGLPVALKFLSRGLAHDPRRLEYFLSEVRLSRQIAHPNVCRVYDIGEVDDTHYLSMEYIDGEDLRSLLRRIGRLPRDKGIEIARQLCRGLAAAHEKGVLHRDLKPANVMIDGRGQVRITDFGLARPASDRSAPQEVVGTPAYMAPEQLTHGETTAQSDIYSLGLILYEVFTGEAAHKASSSDSLIPTHAHQTPRAPSSVVDDINPVVERVVMACLQAEPHQRPCSAETVLAALPGGDSLEAALAAGDTPSPELVAGAGGGRGLSSKVATAVFVAIVIGMAGIALLSIRSQRLINFDAEELIRISQAQDLVREFGYGQSVADSTWGLAWNEQYFRHFQDNKEAWDEWTRLTGDLPTAASFWYREHSEDLVPHRGRGPYTAVVVLPEDPPRDEPGMVSLTLDAHGRMLEFVAAPTGEDLTEFDGRMHVAPAWRSQLLDAAGIDKEVLEREFAPLGMTERPPPPRVFADTWETWQSKSGGIVIEAAAYQGRPVYFRLAPAKEDRARPRPHAFGSIFTLALLGVMGSAVVLARRNWLCGRGDRLGATRLFVFMFAASLLYWLFQAHHVSGMGELAMILMTLARSLLRSVVVCSAYLALEPYLRQRWPHSLIGWNRLLRGRFRDSIVGRDILFGVAAGIIAQLIGSAGLVIGMSRQIVPLAEPILDIRSGPFDLTPLTGPQAALGQICIAIVVGLVVALVMPLFFVVLRTVLRHTSLAAIAIVLFFSMPVLAKGDLHGAVTVALWTSLQIFVFLRYGVLAVAVGFLSWRVLGWPVTFNFSAPHIEIGLAANLLVAGLALYGFLTSLDKKPAAPPLQLNRVSSHT